MSQPLRLTVDIGEHGTLSVRGWVKLADVFLWLKKDLGVKGKESASVQDGHVEFSVEPEESEPMKLIARAMEILHWPRRRKDRVYPCPYCGHPCQLVREARAEDPPGYMAFKWRPVEHEAQYLGMPEVNDERL